MTFSITSPSLVIVEHTEVPIGAEGFGYAGLLARHLVKDARKNGFQIVPICPFLSMWRNKHPETQDVFQV